MRRLAAADVAPELAIATAEVLDASGQHEEAIAALAQAFAGAPPRSDIYWQAAGLLVRNGRISDALGLFEQDGGLRDAADESGPAGVGRARAQRQGSC